MCSGDGAPLPTRGWLRNAQGLRLATYHWPAECGADGGSSPARAGGKGVVVCAHGLGTQPQARAHVRAGGGGGVFGALRGHVAVAPARNCEVLQLSRPAARGAA